MVLRILLSTVLFLTLSCRPEFISHNTYEWHPKKEQFFSFVLNSGGKPKLLKDIDRFGLTRIVNESYPIELVLFDDQTFYYYLENLGDGEGTWSFDEGHIKLYAERKLFAMKIGLHAISEFDNRIAIDFIDRFGTQYLEMDLLKQAQR